MNTGWVSKVIELAKIGDGVSKLFRMALIILLFNALIISSITSCTRGSKISNLRVEAQRLEDKVKLLEATMCECVNISNIQTLDP